MIGRASTARTAEIPARPIRCELSVDRNAEHLQQLFTGFSLLARVGVVTRSERVLSKRADDSKKHQWILTVLINDTIRAAYDVGDRREIDEELLANVDIYFKRSFVPEYVRALKGKGAAKVRPLGLNYEVYSNHIELSGAIRNWRSERGIRRWSGMLRSLRLSPRFAARQRYLESAPLIGAEPRIIFLTRAWDPLDDPERNAIEINNRQEMNETRSACITALRRQFGDRAVAGFAPSEYALRNFRGLVVEDKGMTQRPNYLRTLSQFPICVTTTGLHGSVGWKMGEYVALSKAIVSEPLGCLLPGSFRPGQNFLEFSSADECVGGVDQLITHKALRCSMMMSNYQYYQDYLRPDSLVLNSLQAAITGSTRVDRQVEPRARGG